MRTAVVGAVVIALLLLAGCSSRSNEWQQPSAPSQQVPAPTGSSDMSEDEAINATLSDICGFTDMTTQQAVNVDGVRQVGSRDGPLKVSASKYKWESKTNPALKSDGYKVVMVYTGDNGEVRYEFHWDGEVVRYLNPAAERALNACE